MGRQIEQPDEDDEPILRSHIVIDPCDPRYALLVIQGRFNYGLFIDPRTGDINPRRRCICGGLGNNSCFCDLGDLGDLDPEPHDD